MIKIVFSWKQYVTPGSLRIQEYWDGYDYNYNPSSSRLRKQLITVDWPFDLVGTESQNQISRPRPRPRPRPRARPRPRPMRRNMMNRIVSGVNYDNFCQLCYTDATLMTGFDYISGTQSRGFRSTLIPHLKQGVDIHCHADNTTRFASAGPMENLIKVECPVRLNFKQWSHRIPRHPHQRQKNRWWRWWRWWHICNHIRCTNVCSWFNLIT